MDDDDDGDYPIFDDDYNSADDDFGEVYGYDDEIYGGEDDEIYGDGGHDSDPVEEDQEIAAEEQEHGDDQMEDFPEGFHFPDDEEIAEEEEEQSEEEEIVEEEDGEEFEGEAEAEEEMAEYEGEGEQELMEEVLVEEFEEEVFYGDGVGYWEGDNDNPLLIGTEYEEDPFDVPWLDGVEPCPPTHLRYIYSESESSEFGGDERGIDGSESDSSTERLTQDARVESRRTKSGTGNHDSSWDGFRGPICPICYERWTEEDEHCVCCLPCGHIYGMSCIQTWLERPDSQKCPQCNEACELADVKRLYGMQLATPNEEELQQKVESLEAKCANLETKDADWLRKEAEWQKREADLQQQLNQHKQAEDGLVTDTSVQGDTSVRRDLADDSEPTNALKDR